MFFLRREFRWKIFCHCFFFSQTSKATKVTTFSLRIMLKSWTMCISTCQFSNLVIPWNISFMWDVANTEKLWIMIMARSPKGSDGWESAVRADSQGVRGRSGQRESAKLSLRLSLIPSKKCGNEFWWAWETINNWFKRLNSANVGTSLKQI